MVQSPMARAIRLLLMAPARLVQVSHFEIYKYVAFWVVRTRSAVNKCFNRLTGRVVVPLQLVVEQTWRWEGVIQAN